MRETWVGSLGWEDSLEKGTIILAWRITWTTVHGIAKSWTRLSNFHFHLCMYICFSGTLLLSQWSNGYWHEFEQVPGVGDGQGSLACCSPWGRRESDMTEHLNWTELIYLSIYLWSGIEPAAPALETASLLLFVSVCAGSSLLWGLLSSCMPSLLIAVVSLVAEPGLQGVRASAAGARGLSSCGPLALGHRLSSCDSGA